MVHEYYFFRNKGTAVPSYCPDIISADFILFSKIKIIIKGCMFKVFMKLKRNAGTGTRYNDKLVSRSIHLNEFTICKAKSIIINLFMKVQFFF